MGQTLFQRHKEFEKVTDFSLMKRVPVVLRLDIKNFERISANTTKPFDVTITKIITLTMLALAKEVEGVVFAYQYSDKIVLILRNDQNHDTDPWFGNKIQKMNSVAASIATYEFASLLWQMENPPELNGRVLFECSAFTVPNIMEAVNHLILLQFSCTQLAIRDICAVDPEACQEVKDVLDNQSEHQKAAIFKQLEAYPEAFHRGIGCYLVPTLAATSKGQVTRQQWFVNTSLPRFSERTDFLKTIITTGSDIFRPERDL